MSDALDYSAELARAGTGWGEDSCSRLSWCLSSATFSAATPSPGGWFRRPGPWLAHRPNAATARDC